MDMARSNNWGVPGLAWTTLAIALGTLALTISAPLTTNSQIVLGWTLVAFAVYLRRHRGQVVALTIVVLSIVLGLRYFFWRIEATLLPYWSVSLALGVALIFAEMLVWLRVGIGYIGRIWPVATEVDELPPDAVQWPTIDIFILASDTRTADVQAFVSELPALDWPPNKCRISLLTTKQDVALAQICEIAGITLACFEEVDGYDATTVCNLALEKSEADLLFVADCKSPIPTALLRQTVGWFVAEPRLALVNTPHCFLAPAPSGVIADYLGDDLPRTNWFFARRSVLQDLGGLSSDPTQHTAIRAQRSGHFTAYVQIRSDTKGRSLPCRIDEPFRPASLWLRVRMQQLEGALTFYSPVAFAVFFITPVAVLWGGATPIVTDFFTLCAYWLPQWVLGRLALATALEHQRLRWIDFVQNELSGIAVLLRTAKSFLLTSARRLAQNSVNRTKRTLRSAPERVPTTPRYVLIAVAILFSAIAAQSLYRWQIHASTPLYELYIAWTVFLVLTLLAALAVQREHDWVQWTQTQNQHLRVMVLSGNSHSPITGSTANFPSLPLTVVLNRADVVQTGQSIRLSIFHQYHETVFSCRVVEARGTCISVAFAPAESQELRQLASVVFSRTNDWPQWLPASHADRLLPGWLAKLLRRGQDAFYNLTVKSAAPAFIQRLRAWLKLGNSNNG